MNKNKKPIFFITITLLFAYFFNRFIYFFSTFNNKIYNNNIYYYYNWRFGKIYYSKKGSGTPILLIHDLDSNCSNIEWKELIKILQKNNTLYTIDLLGCGGSDKPKITYTSYLYVQLITDFIKDVIGQPTNVIASGLSTSFTTMACYQNPKYFNKLLYINPINIKQLNNYPTKKNQISKFILELPILGDYIYNLKHSKNNTSRYYKKRFNNKRKIKKSYITYTHQASHIKGENAKYFNASLRNNYININIIHALKQINNSIYILFGSDLTKNLEIQEDYSYYNPSIETSIIENSKYLPHLENPKQVAEICEIYFN